MSDPSRINITIGDHSVSIPNPRLSLIQKLADFIRAEQSYFRDLRDGKTTTWLGEVKHATNGSKDQNNLLSIHIIGGGMQIRNWLRAQDECSDWDGHDFDDAWITCVERALMILDKENNAAAS